MSTEEAACAAVQPLLSAYADQETVPAETAQVEAHLPVCASCRAQLAFLKVLARSANALPVVSLPAGLSERIALATYARPSVWAGLLAALRPAPVRYALGSALTAAVLCAVLLPRLSGSGGSQERVVVVPPVIRASAPPVEPSPVAPIPANPDIPALPVNPVHPALTNKKQSPVVPRESVGVRREPPQVATGMGIATIPHATRTTPTLPTDHHTTGQAQLASGHTTTHSALTSGPLAPKSASVVASAVSTRSNYVPSELGSSPTPTTVARGGRFQGGMVGLVETSGEENPSPVEPAVAEEKMKVALNVTSKQMRDASGALGSLSAAPGGDYPAAGRNLTIVASPVR